MDIIRMGIIRPTDITGMSVVLGGRGAGGNPATTGITGRIDIIGHIAKVSLFSVESTALRRRLRIHLIGAAHFEIEHGAW